MRVTRRFEIFILTALYLNIAVLVPCLGQNLIQNTLECEYVKKDFTQFPSLYEYHGLDVPTIAKSFAFGNTNNTEACTINATRLISFYNFPKERIVAAMLVFACRKPLHIKFTNTNSLQDSFYNVIGYFQVQGCIFEIESLQHFSDAFDMRVVTLNGVPLYDITNRSLTTTRGILGNTVAFSIFKTSTYNSTVLEFMASGEIFPEMREVSFLHMDWSELPPGIIHTFPFLESLELQNNKFSKPPEEFPWNDAISYLPRNLSRSRIFQSHYSLALNIDIQPNVYRRLYNLDNNNIRSLKEYKFHGILQMISLNNNSLRDIGEQCFRQVMDLQNIGLADNELTSLPVGFLRGLTSLRHLDIHNNFIEILSEGMFDDSVNLVYINLASNRLSSLGEGLFVKLLNLETLLLDGNNILVISEASFPLHSIALTTVGLSSNPLREIPKITYYIRSLRRINLRNTSITLTNYSGQLEEMDSTLLKESVIKSSSESNADIFARPSYLREIDLSESLTQGFELSSNINEESKIKFIIVLIHFHFNFYKSPLRCDCGIIPLINTIRQYTQKATITFDDYFFHEWTCVYPQELAGRVLLKINESETYCGVNISFCPDTCTCYRRSVSLIIIVDCRYTDMMALPLRLPEGVLDLWFQRNNITRIESRNYLNRVRRLSLNANQISQVDGDAVSQLDIIENLDLSSNNMIGLPEQIQFLHLTELIVSDNPFSCDCHSLWMRSWIERNKDVVIDSSTLTCNTQIGTARPLLKVPTTEFVCKQDFNARKHVIIPATVSSLSVSLVLVVIALVCIYRLEVKVFLYIYLGIRPFDKEKKLTSKSIDLVVFHSPETQAWVTEHISPLAVRKNRTVFNILYLCNDCVAGFSFHDNIACLVENTRKVLFVLSKEFLDDNKLQIAWTEVKNRIPDNGVGFIQFVTDNVLASDVLDSEMASLMKHTRYLSTQERFIRKKILYYMPHYGTSEDIHVLPVLQSLLEKRSRQTPENFPNRNNGIFLTYSEDLLAFIITKLCPKLQECGYSLCLPDRDFILGAAKEENILQAVSTSLHTLFIVSEYTFVDEWSLFTFRAAAQRSLRDKYNHLVVVLMCDVNTDTVQDEELRHYLKSHVTLSAGDENFWRKLRLSLRQVRNFTSQARGDLCVTNNNNIALTDIVLNM
ncbi:toll-like receptor 6 [Mizuhopecten yessoensis]|uniref:toll-like receptor 6 n=1 Tax=Mizuhopecten yessoensis TaxID=6573 RepID=UPI000B459B73|nr:toll-like receptor 6 [Mizuhopecten yessoensis]